MNRRTPESLLICTRGANASKLMERPSSQSSSKLGSLEMQARWITASQPATASATTAGSRRSPLISLRAGSPATASSTSSP